jgi:RNA polymerase sigma-70 factor (ECF subfamily)
MSSAEAMEHTIPSSGATAIPFDELLGHRAWVRALARSLVNDQATADDIEQQTWLAALRRPPSERATVRAWFATVVRNAVRERGRASGRRERREAAAARPEGTATTADVVARAESHKRVVLAVMDLPEPYRGTVLLRFFEELPPRDVAARTGTPVETVRTRTRRALVLLRERLDEDEGGNRDAWKRALAPLLLPLDPAEPGVAPDTARGGDRMFLVKLAAVAALVVAIPTGIALMNGDDTAATDVGSTEGAPVAAAEDGGGRNRVVPPPRPVTGEEEEGGTADGDAKGGERVVWGPQPNPLPEDTDASVYANGKLSIHLSVEPAQPRAGEPFHIVTTFRNDGTGPARFHIPQHSGTVPFPRITLRAANGKLYTPVPPSFQSEAGRGLLGKIVRLEAGEEHAVKSYVSSVAEVSPDEAYADREVWALSQKSHDLLPGDFTLAARHTKADATVPYAGEDWGVTHEEVAGLFTGEVRATEVTMRLAPPEEVMLTLRAPEKIVPGVNTTVTLEIANPSQEDKELRGALRIWRSQKGSTPYWASFDFFDGRAVVAAADDEVVRTLAAGETHTISVDLGELVWTRLSDRRDWMGRDRWPFDREYCAVWVTAGPRDWNDRGSSNSLFVALDPGRDLADAGLRLRVVTDGLLAEKGYLDVHLRNDAADAVTVPARLATPRRIAVSLERVEANGRRRAEIRIADAEPYAPLAASDLRTLGTGEELYVRVALAPDWRAKIAAGRYRLRVHWASLDGCDRDGFDAAARPLIGRLTSAPVEITIPDTE